MDNQSEKILKGYYTNFVDIINGTLRRACIIEYGIIKEVNAVGVVTVASAVAKNANDVRVMTCALLGTSTSKCSVYVEPSVGDKVLVVHPRRFSRSMFRSTDIVQDSSAEGYNLLSGLAIPLNQFAGDSKSYIKLTSEGIDVSLQEEKFKFKSTANGINLTDAKGNTIVADDTKLVLNGNLEVSQ